MELEKLVGFESVFAVDRYVSLFVFFTEPPRERPRLQLQPRTKPIEITEEKKEPEPKSQRSTASIFGSAKPVDTAQREREIEERLMKQRQEAPANKSTLESRGYGTSRGYEEPREQKRHDSHENKENRNL